MAVHSRRARVVVFGRTPAKPQRFAEQFGFATTTAIDRIDNDRAVDRIDVCLSTHVHTDLQQLAVSYDEAGTVSVAAMFFQPEPQGSLDVRVELGPTCGYDEPSVTLRMSHSPYMTSGSASLTGYVDKLSFVPTISADGRTVTGTVSHPALANQNFRCVRAAYAYGTEVRFDDVPDTWFVGHEPLVLDSGTATAHADAWLAAR